VSANNNDGLYIKPNNPNKRVKIIINILIY
jgi:hypothetical protein